MTTPKRPSGGLTPDERALWEHVAQQVRPLKPRTRVLDTATTEPAPALPKRVPGHEHQTHATTEVTPAKPRWRRLPHIETPRPAATSTDHSNGFDPRRARRIADGRIEIDGRIDLHGLTEADAHLRLRGFLRQAHAQGKRTVLVVTGKGREADDDPTLPFDFGIDRSRRGIIKRNTPRWLTEPDLARIVVSYTTAHPRHGGDGAIYVHLRRLRG